MTERPTPIRPAPGSTPRPRHWVPSMLALVAEAAWIAVIADLLQALVRRPSTIGVPELLLAALAGLGAARVLGSRGSGRWPRVAVLLAAACGLVGWLWPADVRTMLLAQGPASIGGSLATNPAGWLAALALVRGMSYAVPPLASRDVGRLLAIVVPGLAVAASIGGTLHEPWRTGFMFRAEIQVLLFLGAALPALALARMAEVSGGAVLDWRRNPGWLVMVALLLGASAALAVSASAGAGPALSTLAWALAAPLLVAGAIWSVDRRGVQLIVSSLMVMGVAGVTVVALASGPGATLRALLARWALSGDRHVGNPVVTALLAVIAVIVVATPLVVALAIVVAVVRSLLRLHAPVVAGVTEDETREIDRSTEPQRLPRSRRRSPFRRGPAPTDAVTAYRALLRDLDGHPLVARAASETPAEHAGRLRGAGLGDLRLDLLAADYGLVRFGGAALTAAENRRAIVRAAALRRRLTARAPRSRPGENALPPG